MSADAIPDSANEVAALKSDSFGRIALMRDVDGLFVRRDLVHVPLWLRLPAWWKGPAMRKPRKKPELRARP